MKALSIRSDYAADIMNGTKTEEYRSWSTKYRGDLLICNTAKKIRGFVPGYAFVLLKSLALSNGKTRVALVMLGKLLRLRKMDRIGLNQLRLRGNCDYLILMIT